MERIEQTLAFAKSSPRLLVVVIPLLVIVAHLSFIYGQVQIMWYLDYSLHTDFKVTAKSWESSIIFQALGIHNPLHMNFTKSQRLQEFTYGNAISKLWIADGLDNVLLPRAGAFILVIFSGIWPHMKLIMLQVMYFKKVSYKIRAKMLYWLSALGKYSLADVFLVCILIAVCNLNIHLNADSALKGLKHMVPNIVTAVERAVNEHDAIEDVCNGILQLGCQLGDNSGSAISCSVCLQTVSHYYEHPKQLAGFLNDILNGIAIEGKGAARLRIAGLAGLHVFCAAVLLSLILSVLMDILNHRYKLFEETEDPVENEIETPLLQEAQDVSEKDISEELVEERKIFLTRLDPDVIDLGTYVFLVAFTTGLLGLTFVSISLPTMERTVPGSIPSVINETIYYDFKEEVSLASLVNLIGVKGGWDFFLKCLFMLFCIVGPALRLGLILIQLVVPAKKEFQQLLLLIIDQLGAFCALDVYFMAMVLVQIEIGPITNTIIDEDSKFCKLLLYAGYPESCLTINFHVLGSFACLILQYLGLTWLNMHLHKLNSHIGRLS